MTRQPDGPSLLMLARNILLKDLLPLLPDERRVDALMIANVMGIAARELASGSHPLEAELAGLAHLLGEAAEDESESLTEGIERLRWRLVSEIRSGKRDADAAIHAFLSSAAKAYLGESNPKALKAAGPAD